MRGEIMMKEITLLVFLIPAISHAYSEVEKLNVCLGEKAPDLGFLQEHLQAPDAEYPLASQELRYREEPELDGLDFIVDTVVYLVVVAPDGNILRIAFCSSKPLTAEYWALAERIKTAKFFAFESEHPLLFWTKAFLHPAHDGP